MSEKTYGYVRCHKCGCLRRPESVDPGGACKDWDYCTQHRANGSSGPQLPVEKPK